MSYSVKFNFNFQLFGICSEVANRNPPDTSPNTIEKFCLNHYKYYIELKIVFGLDQFRNRFAGKFRRYAHTPHLDGVILILRERFECW